MRITGYLYDLLFPVTILWVKIVEKLTTIKSERGFDRFLSNENCVIIVHHFLCHGCQVYLENLKNNLEILSAIPIARIHMTLTWVIDEAGLYGDVEEENIFLRDRFGVGNLFPTTLFFQKGKLIKRVDGSMTADQLKDMAVKTFSS
jgi:hypothetical protein